MSVRLKLVIIVLFVALVPISVSAWISLGIHQQAIEQNLTTLHQAAAAHEAQRVGAQLKNLEDNLQVLVTNTVPWAELSPIERQAALWLLYRSHQDIVVVMLLDDKYDLLSQPAYLTDATAGAEPQHVPEPPSIVATLLRHLPKPALLGEERSFGKPFLVSADQDPILPISLPLVKREPGQTGFILAVGISLRTICQPGVKPEAIDLLIVDSADRNLCQTPHWRPLTAADAALGKQADASSSIRTYFAQDGRELLSAVAALPHGWHVIAEQPVEKAFSASRNMRQKALLWILISVAIALTSGLLLARSITLPVQRLVNSAQELARGNLEHRLDLPERDEFGRLGRAFNQMATEVAARDAEIREWNLALQRRVEERTLAIERYHDHLVHAEKSAVIAQLTAGLAAEVNDPLTGILGAVQFIAARASADPARAQEARLFANAEQGAQRIRALIKRVQALGQRQPKSQLRSLAVGDLVSSVTGLLETSLLEARIDLQLHGADTAPTVLGNFTQLEQALLQVLSNAMNACSAASRLAAEALSSAEIAGPKDSSERRRICIQLTRVEQGMVQITVSDDGIGIPNAALESIFEPFVTLRPDSGAGLGLTIARRIVEEHGGRIWAESNDGGGATLKLQLATVGGQAP